MANAPEELRTYMAQANGFETHYQHRMSGMSYSEGVKYVAEVAGAYWLIDAILINSRHKRLQQKCEGMEFWTLKVDLDKHSAVLTCTDGGIGGAKAKRVCRQVIEYTDFPLEEIEFYNEGGILMLTAER